MWGLNVDISEYPNDYNLYLKFSGLVAEFCIEASGQPNLTFELSLNELIRAGEWAKKFKEATK